MNGVPLPAKSSRVAVLIPTTSNPVSIVSLTEEDPDVGRSTICINKTTNQAGIAAAYNDFVKRPTGLVHRLFGKPPYPVYRLDVTGPIEAGSSWQLAVLIAHALREAGDRLTYNLEDSAEIVWATGEVNPVDYSVGSVEHVPEKLQKSYEIFEKAMHAGKRVHVLIPTQNWTDVDQQIKAWMEERGLYPRAINTIDEAFQAVALPALPLASSRAVRQSNYKPKVSLGRIAPIDSGQNHGGSREGDAQRNRWWELAITICLAAILVGGLAVLKWFNENEAKKISNSGAANADTSVIPVSCNEESALRSEATTTPTSIVFINKSNDIRKVYWLDHTGKRIPYGRLMDGNVLSLRTYITHPWVITDDEDNCKFIYMPTTSAQSIAIK